MKAPIRAGADAEALKRLLTAAIAAKPEKHHLAEGQRIDTKMSSIGG